MDRQISVPIKKEDALSLRAGDYVTLTGTIYTARDAAHKRMQEALDAGESLPIEMQGNVIYYMGPSPAREGRPIGSAGPTTASRMDKYAPKLLDLGRKGKEKPGCDRRHRKKWFGLFRSDRRRRGSFIPAHQKIRGSRL